MSFLPLFRMGALGLSSFFALVILGLVGHFTFESNKFGVTADFEGLGIATACLTLLTLPTMLITGALRKRAFTTMVVVELAWLGVLWVLWLATGADSAQYIQLFYPLGCGAEISIVKTACNELSTISGLSFINWLLLMGYSITLLVFSIIGHTRGQGVWTSSVTEANFLVARDTAPGNVSLQPATQQYQYPPNSAESHSQPTPQIQYATPPPPGHSAHIQV